MNKDKIEQAEKLKTKAVLFIALFVLLFILMAFLTSRTDTYNDIGMYLFEVELSKVFLLGIIIMVAICIYIQHIVIEESSAKYRKNQKYKKMYTYSLISQCALYNSLLSIFLNFLFKIQRQRVYAYDGINVNKIVNERVAKYLNKEYIVYFIYALIAAALVVIFKFMCLYVMIKLKKRKRSVK